MEVSRKINICKWLIIKYLQNLAQGKLSPHLFFEIAVAGIGMCSHVRLDLKLYCWLGIYSQVNCVYLQIQPVRVESKG